MIIRKRQSDNYDYHGVVWCGVCHVRVLVDGIHDVEEVLLVPSGWEGRQVHARQGAQVHAEVLPLESTTVHR